VLIRVKGYADAFLARVNELLPFFTELGFAQPEQKQLEDLRLAALGKAAREKWFESAPKCFNCESVERGMNSGDFIPETISELVAKLNIEYNNRDEQVVALLNLYGTTEKYWTACPAYESLPHQILIEHFTTIDMVRAYRRSTRDYSTRKGFGRFLCAYMYHGVVRVQRNENLRFILPEILDEIEECFVDIGEAEGARRIQELRERKTRMRFSE